MVIAKFVYRKLFLKVHFWRASMAPFHVKDLRIIYITFTYNLQLNRAHNLL